jgi:hypothetical protein
MTRMALTTACAACLFLPIGSLRAYGQDDADVFQVRMTEYLESNGLPGYTEMAAPDGLTVDGNIIRADEYTLDQVTREVTASGNVTIVMTRADGSSVTIQTDQLRTRGYRQEPSAAELREARRPLVRARELGVTAFRNELPITLMGVSGRYVFADDFRLDPVTNEVDAIGNVRVMS